MQIQDNTETCYQRGNRSTREKPLRGPLSQNDPLVNKDGIQRYQKDPPSLIYPLYLNPLSSSSQWTSPSHFFTSYSNPTISSKLHPPRGLSQVIHLRASRK